jgi:hypothetical protein
MDYSSAAPLDNDATRAFVGYIGRMIAVPVAVMEPVAAIAVVSEEMSSVQTHGHCNIDSLG